MAMPFVYSIKPLFISISYLILWQQTCTVWRLLLKFKKVFSLHNVSLFLTLFTCSENQDELIHE